jgi:hypothetical protein
MACFETIFASCGGVVKRLNIAAARELVFASVFALVASAAPILADVVSVPFNEGFVGTVGTNAQKANNIITFADIGFTVALVQQNSTSGVFESVQGNDVPADLVITKGSVVYTISGTITWKMKSGSNLEVFGFIPSSSAATYIISHSGGTYTLDSTSNYGLVEVEESLAALGIATGDDVTGSADSSTLTQLNAYLATVLANNPSGPVTVTTLSTSDSTPTLTGTVTLSGSETLTVSANGTLYTTSDSLVVDSVAGTWSLTLPTTTIGTYDVVATVTNTTGYTL